MPIRPTALAAAAVLVATAFPSAATARPADRAGSSDDAIVAVHLTGADRASGALSRSTMLAATPLDLPADRAVEGNVGAPARAGGSGQTEPTGPDASIDPVDPIVRAAGAPPVPPRTTGKLFFKKPNGRNYVCSAAVLAHPKQNIVVTAGHCVAEAGQGAKGYHSAFRFVPAYADGTAPYGSWTATSFYTFKGWLTRTDDYAHDQAFLRMAANADDQKIEQVTGGNGMKWGEDAAGTGNVAWGWPAQDPYDGETARRCAGTTTEGRFASGPSAVLPCRMNGGASGGPWMRPQTSKNRGYVFAVTSRRTTTGTPRVLAVPFSASMKKLYDKLAK